MHSALLERLNDTLQALRQSPLICFDVNRNLAKLVLKRPSKAVFACAARDPALRMNRPTIDCHRTDLSL